MERPHRAAPAAESLGDMRHRVPSSKREATLRCCWQKPPAFGDEIIKSRPPLRLDVKRLGRLVITRTQRTPTMRHTRTGLSHFVFPDYESSPRCATDLVFYRCMRMSPLAPPAGGAFFMRAVCNRCCVGLWTQKPTERVGVECWVCHLPGKPITMDRPNLAPFIRRGSFRPSVSCAVPRLRRGSEVLIKMPADGLENVRE
jgi:hypothetical protein